MNELLAEGLNLMLMGMGAVFVFLTLLVFTTNFMSKMVGKYAPQPVPAATKPAQTAQPAQPVQAVNDPQMLAVITAAIHQHRSYQK